MALEELKFSSNSLWSPIAGGITVPMGFIAAGITAGLKSSCKPDLALLVAPEGAVCAGTFTQSLARAACIDLCIERLKVASGKVRAVLINSGQANACTGTRGFVDSVYATQKLADLLNFKTEEVLMCSTGVIGEPIPIENLINALDHLVEDLDQAGGEDAATAILTTDLVKKQIAYEACLDGRPVRIGGMAKGSGMIHPNMATMLGYITCDASIPADYWSKMIHRVADGSFNAITVDGDTSTNDSFIAFSAGDELPREYWDTLENGLLLVAQHLAKAITRDGEGANCLLQVEVKGAETDSAARKIARAICSSSLVKTAIHGCDANWGRIVAAAGSLDSYFSVDQISLAIGSHQLIKFGQPLAFDRNATNSYIRERMNGEYLIDDCVEIALDLGHGSGCGIAWGCDLSDQYVRINADYTT